MVFGFLFVLLLYVFVFLIGSFAFGYLFRKGWEAAAPKPSDQGPFKPT